MQLLTLRIPALLALCFALVIGLPAAQADNHGGGEVRVAAVQVSAVITDIDYESREVTLQVPSGSFITMTAGSEIERFDERRRHPGDFSDPILHRGRIRPSRRCRQQHHRTDRLPANSLHNATPPGILC